MPDGGGLVRTRIGSNCERQALAIIGLRFFEKKSVVRQRRVFKPQLVREANGGGEFGETGMTGIGCACSCQLMTCAESSGKLGTFRSKKTSFVTEARPVLCRVLCRAREWKKGDEVVQ